MRWISSNSTEFASFECRFVQDFTDSGFRDGCERQEMLAVEVFAERMWSTEMWMWSTDLSAKT